MYMYKRTCASPYLFFIQHFLFTVFILINKCARGVEGVRLETSPDKNNFLEVFKCFLFSGASLFYIG